MSEPSSLYARFTLSQAGHEAFMRSRPPPATDFDDWQAWFDRRRMAGDGRVTPQMLAAPQAETVAEQLSAWQSDAWFGMPPPDYDPETGILRIAMLQASENYGEMIHLLSPLRGAAAHAREGAGDFILIFDFMWGDGDPPDAHLVLDGGRTRFDDAVPPTHLDEARAALEAVLEGMQAQED